MKIFGMLFCNSSMKGLFTYVECTRYVLLRVMNASGYLVRASGSSLYSVSSKAGL